MRETSMENERGAVLALVVVMMVSFLFIVGFVVEVGNWLEHRRHLQMQVDSGALATGSKFSGCFLEPAQANDRIEAEAHRYAGNVLFPTIFANLFPGDPIPAGPYNGQVDDPTRVQFALNPGSGYPPGAVDFAAGEPCDTRSLDVRANDIDIPAFFSGVLPDGVDLVNVKARAKVEIRKVEKLSGFLPWAVPEQDPNDVLVIFVDESSGAVRGVQPLVKQSIQTLNGQALSLWSANASFTGHSQAGTGAIIATSKLPVGTVSTTGTLAQICGQSPANVACYSGSTATSGMWYTQGFAGGSGCVTTSGPPPLPSGVCSQPRLGSVTLQSASCADTSAPYFLLNGNCTVTVQANVDFGTGNPLAFPTCAKVSANGTALSYQGGTLWTGNITVPDVSGRNVVNVNWGTWRNGNGATCNQTSTYSDTFSKVAAPYAADDAAGPISYLRITNVGTGALLGSLGTNVNNTTTTFVEVGIEPPLRVANPGDPPILLRFASKSGSLNQALDCDKAPRGLDEEVADGCQTFYAVNKRGEVCVGPPGPTWTPSNLPPTTFDPDPVPDCIQAKTGDVTSMAKGLHERFETPCFPNNWETYRQNGELPPDTDPRWVTLVVTNFTAFSGQGVTVVPIRVFAGFYVTGYFHAQTATGCPEDDLPPPPACASWPNDNGSPACDPDNNKQKGNVWGYFVTNVILDQNGQPDKELCAFNEIGICVAILTE